MGVVQRWWQQMGQSFTLKWPLFFLFIFLGHLVFGIWFPLYPRYNYVPLSDIRKFAPTLLHALLYTLLLLGLFAALSFIHRRWQQEEPSLSLLQLIGLTLLLALPLLPTYPINANDLYRYFIRGRITTVYDANPFEVSASDFAGDVYLPLAGEWADATSPYGPLWELTAAGITAVFPDDLLLGLIAFKLLGLLTHLAITILLWRILSGLSKGKRAAYTILWAWNPAVFLILVVDAHNDGLMLFWLLLGWWVASQRQKPTLGMMVMVLGVLTKPIGILPLPFFFLYFWHHLPSGLARARFAGFVGIGSSLMVVLAFVPFGSPMALMQRLIAEASGGGGFSPVAWVYFIGVAVGQQLSLGLLGNLFRYGAAVVTLWLLWRTWQNGRSPLVGAADIFGLYILQALSFRIWYALWLIPWLIAALARSETERNRVRLWAGLTFLLTAQLSVLIYGHVRIFLLERQQLLAHLIGVPFTFGLPWLLLIIRRRQNKE